MEYEYGLYQNLTDKQLQAIIDEAVGKSETEETSILTDLLENLRSSDTNLSNSKIIDAEIVNNKLIRESQLSDD